jgi:hypothetical protein
MRGCTYAIEVAIHAKQFRAINSESRSEFSKKNKKSVPKVNVLTLTHLDQYISLDIGDNKSEKNNV